MKSHLIFKAWRNQDALIILKALQFFQENRAVATGSLAIQNQAEAEQQTVQE